jgi:hypothetical protein
MNGYPKNETTIRKTPKNKTQPPDKDRQKNIDKTKSSLTPQK